MPSTHHQFLEAIMHDPQLIGLDFSERDLAVALKEYVVYKDGRTITEIDLVMGHKYGLYVVEYKCHDSVKQRKKAQHQLKTAKQCLKDKFSWDVDYMLYVHDWFVTEELLDGWKPLDYNVEYLLSVEDKLRSGKRTGERR
jgi:hypothetical protein